MVWASTKNYNNSHEAFAAIEASTIAIIHENNSSDKGSNNYHNLLIEVLIRNDKDAKDEGSER
jgi:hypothetical protein